jgi:hypothetical protein
VKIRSGFVSNSSSSSFIIAQKMTGYCEHCGRSDPDIISILQHSNNDDNYALEDWKDNLYDDDKHIIKIAEEYEKKKDYKVYYVSVSYHDEAINDLIKKSKDIEIIHDFE